MRIGNFALWVSAEDARSLGCTHHARFYGLVPGFVAFEPDGLLWVSRSDAFAWFEDALSMFARFIRSAEGENPLFVFRVSRPIDEVVHEPARTRP